jgi:cation diffusion facilitator family transporter
MSHACEHHAPAPSTIQNLPRYRRVLWLALWINAAMFAVELFSGWQSGSLSLLADSIDFAGDALNYGVSLAVLSAALVWRSRAAVVKALCMMGFGALILGRAVWSLYTGTVPDAATMGVIGLLALISNVAVAWMLYAFREGDANMRSVWLCSRNDAIGNVLVMLAAAGVLGTGSGWPDLLVAAGMAVLALQGGWQVMRQARRELAQGPDAAHPHDDHHHGHSH